MHRKRSKRRQRIQLTFIYTLMALAVVSIVAILVLAIQGYRYNKYDGKLEQGGLVQFDSRPSGATVTADSVTLANKTASKVTLTSGRHTITMTKDGYSTWKKDVLVRPGSVLWLNYTLLFPNSPTITAAARHTAVTSAVPSTNRKVVAAVAKADTPEVYLTTLNDDTPTTTKVVIPATAFTAPGEGETQAFTLLGWDKGSNLLLVRHAYGQKTEYLSLDTRSAKTHNITTELGVAIVRVNYSLGDSNVLYILTEANELRRVTLDSATVSGPLATNVADFSIDEERVIAYTTLPDADGARSVGYVSPGASKAKTIASYSGAASLSLHVATGNYYGDHYVSILCGEALTVFKGDLPSSDSDTRVSLKRAANLTVAGGGDYLGFSPDTNRMIYVAKGTKIVTHDLELASSATLTLQDALTRDVQWLDAFHIFAIGQTGYYYDYDGTNGQLFASSTLDLPAVYSENGKYLYYFTTAKDGVVLQRAKMTISN